MGVGGGCRRERRKSSWSEWQRQQAQAGSTRHHLWCLGLLEPLVKMSSGHKAHPADWGEEEKHLELAAGRIRVSWEMAVLDNVTGQHHDAQET